MSRTERLVAYLSVLLLGLPALFAMAFFTVATRGQELSKDAATAPLVKGESIEPPKLSEAQQLKFQLLIKDDQLRVISCGDPRTRTVGTLERAIQDRYAALLADYRTTLKPQDTETEFDPSTWTFKAPAPTEPKAAGTPGKPARAKPEKPEAQAPTPPND